jgi:hypothetical protein
MQFAMLLPIFLVSVLVVAARERRLLEFLKTHKVLLAGLLVIAGGLFAIGPARNSGYYPSFLYVPNFHLAQAAKYLGADTLVLSFAAGFVLIPGAILGIWLALTKARARTELAFGVLTVLLTIALLAQAVIYGNLGFVQERYLFYILPLWTLAFLLYAQREWPLKIAHGVIAIMLLVAALAQPLSKYAVGSGQAHSAFLFALTWLAKPTGSLGAASVLIAYAAGAGLVVIAGLAFRWPRVVTPFAVAFLLLATTGSSIAATLYDHSNAGAIRTVVLGDHPSFVDEAGVGPTALLLMPGSQIPDAKLFWNTSIDRLLLLPGVKPPDPFVTSTVDVANNGIVSVGHEVVTGPVMIDDWGATVQLQQATLVRRTTSGALYRPHGGLRFRLLVLGRYQDGWLAGRGAIIVWPTAGEQGVAGRLEIPVRGPGAASTATIRIGKAGSTAQPRAYSTTPGATRTISVPLCSSGPITLTFSASPAGGIGDGRAVAARSGAPRFIPDPAGCTLAPRAPTS